MPDPLFDTRPDEFTWEPWPGPNDWTNLEWFEFCYIQLARPVAESFRVTFDAAKDIVKKLMDYDKVGVASGRALGKNYVSVHTFKRSMDLRDFDIPKKATLPPPITRNHGPRPKHAYGHRGKRQY